MNFLKIALIILKIIRIVLPLILIIMVTMDYYEAIFKKDSKGLKESTDHAVKRLIAALVILFFPTILNIYGNISNDSSFMTCIQNATPEGINNAFITSARLALEKAIETESSSDISKAQMQIRRVKDQSVREELSNQINELINKTKENTPKDSIIIVEDDPNKSDNPNEQVTISSGASLKTFTASNDKTLNYYEVVPNDPTNNMPLIIYLHGDWEAEDINRIEDLAIYNYAKSDSKKYVFIAPHSPYKDWISANVTAALKELIDKTIIDYSIDKNKIIIMGASRGSIGTWNMIAKYGSFFSAAVPISYFPTTNGDPNAYTSVAIYGVSGNSGDFESSINSNMISFINRIKNAGGDAEMHTISGKTHNDISNNLPLNEMFNWVLDK